MEHCEQEMPVLRLEDLAISYETRRAEVTAVRDVTFQIRRGETFGLVGESGCGKSTVAFGIVGALGRNGHVTEGRILFQGQDLVGRPEAELRHLRGNQIAMVYQNPMLALNPSLRIGDQLSEALIFHNKMSKAAAFERSVEVLKQVYMPDAATIMRRYPHQLSGGQQQRVIIAMALLNNPALLIMDEPTTALDVTVEAAVLDLIGELRHRFNTAILYISHNLGVIARVCDRVGVMYAGKIVEEASVQEIFDRPTHPYTKGLLRCIPKLGTSKRTNGLSPIRGQVPLLENLPPGCVFAPRCDYADAHCLAEYPRSREIDPAHYVRCHNAEAVAQETRATTKRQLTPAPEREMDAEPILQLEGLKTHYEQESASLLSLFGLSEKRYTKAVDGVDLALPKGATLGIVGESGCGKSTLAKTVVGLEAPTGGRLEFMGIDISAPVAERDFDAIRELQMVFQNPESTLNPAFSIGFQISRPLRRFGGLSRAEARQQAIHLLKAVKLDESYYDRLPRQLSGGQKQRVAIARAIATQPGLVVCDEPTSALDVSVQAVILNLLLDLQREEGISMVFISHDLSVVRFLSDYVAVMYLGKICEVGRSEAIYAPPYHPYTEALLSAVPVPDPSVKRKRVRLSETVPSALNPPKGCRFHTRCPHSLGTICEREAPPAQDDGDGHVVYCHIPLEELRTWEPVIATAPWSATGRLPA